MPVDPNKIHLTVRDRTKILFNDYVKALTSYNEAGIFDILPEHSNFISLINTKIIIHKLDKTTQEIPLVNGIVKIKDYDIRCFINILAKDVTT
jgi:F0F1-type ATP synthase epsilon subunit